MAAAFSVGPRQYRGEQPLLRRDVVVKVLHQRQGEVALLRFLREAQLDPPYAAHVHACRVEDEDGIFWIAMKRVQAGPSVPRGRPSW